MFEISHNMGTDMMGKYFVQFTNNEDALKKLKKINKNGDMKFYTKKYSENDINMLQNTLSKFNNLLDLSCSDNVERFIFNGEFNGEFNVPGDNKVYSKNELLTWWENYFEDPKYPKWSNMFNTIIDLTRL